MKNWVQVLYEHCTLHLYEHRTLHQGVHIHQLAVWVVRPAFSSFSPSFLSTVLLFNFILHSFYSYTYLSILLLSFYSQYYHSPFTSFLSIHSTVIHISRPHMNTYLYILPRAPPPSLSSLLPPSLSSLLTPSHRHPSVLPLFHIHPLPLFFFLPSF